MIVLKKNAGSFIREVKRFESSMGSYTYKDHKEPTGQQDKVLPNDALVLMITLNQGSTKQAFSDLLADVMNDGKEHQIKTIRK